MISVMGYYVLTVLAFLVIAMRSIEGDVLQKYAQVSGSPYHGRYTRDIHEGHLVLPRRVFEDGSFNTYELPHFYDRRDLEERRKRRRVRAVLDEEEDEDSEDENEDEQGEESSPEDKLHLVLPLDGIDHHVELSPYHGFISPELVVETRGEGISSNLNRGVKFKRAADRQCHYRGTIRGHDNSRAALSLCDGVAGYVQTDHGRYFIEPMHEVEPEVDGQHVHVAFKRTAHHEDPAAHRNDRSKRNCATNDNWEAAWTEQLLKRQERLAENKDSSLRAVKDVEPSASGTHSIHRYIELCLVCDRRFLDFHNGTDYEAYLLTIGNMMSDFYHDNSAGNQIDVVLVRIIYLEKEKEEIDLLITPAAEDTLDSFAKWAAKMNPEDPMHPNHYDIAALITRYDICSEGTNCDLMGLAFVAAACDVGKAACINEDNGLLLGIVVAHEVGHVMGCSHDELDVSGCDSQDKDESYFVMSPIVFIYTIRWSPCSRKFITAFLESGLGDCLNNEPKEPPDKYKYPNMLPGAMYDAEYQCDMTFPGSKVCPQSTIDNCEKLWCLTNSSCFSVGTPKADGTKCGEKKWCIHKKCVEIGERPKAVNGGWSEWGPISSCSRTCGGGLKYSERECNTPAPANSGRYCIGERKRMTICNTTPCDSSKPPFRAVQCANHNNESVLADGLHQWQPYLDPSVESCALYCINENQVFIKIQITADDSTPCKAGTNNMCIAGTCRKVGCDWVIDSESVDDRCGICKGDGTHCNLVQGEFTSKPTDVYMKVVTIPRGARSIAIKELKPSPNTLSVKMEKSNEFCLNANNVEQKSGDYECAGTSLIYTHPEPDREEIEMKGPITNDIQIMYVFFDPKTNVGVHYEYTLRSAYDTATPNYMWDFLEWSECSAKCGGGTMVAEPSCVEEHAGKVTPSFCNGVPRPEPKSRICNEHPCPAKWRVSQWSKCSACDGKSGTKHRKVQCVKTSARPGEDDVQANLDACKGRVPKQEETCVGTRPCRKKCKKVRSPYDESIKKRSESQNDNLSPEEESKMIDRFVDLELAKYLNRIGDASLHEESSGKSNDAHEFRQLLREWIMGQNLHSKTSGSCSVNFTTPKPGSIVKDAVPENNVVLMEAPFMEEYLKSNLSDKAFRESGDVVGVGLDLSKEKVYKGSKALKLIEELAHNTTDRARKGRSLFAMGTSISRQG